MITNNVTETQPSHLNHTADINALHVDDEPMFLKVAATFLERALADGWADHVGGRQQKDGMTSDADVVITEIHDADSTHRGFAKLTRVVGESAV